MEQAEQRGSVAREDGTRGAGVFVWFLVIAVAGLGVLTLLLVQNNRSLKTQVHDLEQALARERTRDSLATGDRLSTLVTFDSNGVRDERTFRTGKATVVFLLASKCPYCEETIPVWREAIAATHALDSGKVDLLTIQTDAKRADELKPIGGGLDARYAEQHAGTWLLRVPVSPGAMLVDGNGVVRRVWFGMPSETDKNELVQALLGAMPER